MSDFQCLWFDLIQISITCVIVLDLPKGFLAHLLRPNII